jgi:hypothetical protein
MPKQIPLTIVFGNVVGPRGNVLSQEYVHLNEWMG